MSAGTAHGGSRGAHASPGTWFQRWMPGSSRSQPSTQIEAILCGTPLVSADIPGAREVVEVTGMGVRVAPRDPVALARGIVEVLRNRDAWVRPPSEVRAVFDAEKSVAEYEELLSRLAIPRAAAA